MFSSEIADLEQFIDSYVGPESRTTSGDWTQAHSFEEGSSTPGSSRRTSDSVNHNQDTGTEFWGQKPGGKEWGGNPEHTRNFHHWNEHKPKIEQRENAWQQNLARQPEFQMQTFDRDQLGNPEFQPQSQNPNEIQAIVSDLIRKNNRNKVQSLPSWVDVTRPPPFFPTDDHHPPTYSDQYLQEQEQILQSMTFQRTSNDNPTLPPGSMASWGAEEHPPPHGAYVQNAQEPDWHGERRFYHPEGVPPDHPDFRPPHDYYQMPLHQSFPQSSATGSAQSTHNMQRFLPPAEQQRFSMSNNHQHPLMGSEQPRFVPPQAFDRRLGTEQDMNRFSPAEQQPYCYNPLMSGRSDLQQQDEAYRDHLRSQEQFVNNQITQNYPQAVRDDAQFYPQPYPPAQQPINFDKVQTVYPPGHPEAQNLPHGLAFEQHSQIRNPPEMEGPHQHVDVNHSQPSPVPPYQGNQAAVISQKPPHGGKPPKGHPPVSPPKEANGNPVQSQHSQSANEKKFPNSRLRSSSDRQRDRNSRDSEPHENAAANRRDSDHSRSGSEVFENETDERWRTHNFKVHVPNKKNNRRRSSAADDDPNWRSRDSGEESKTQVNNRLSSSDSDPRNQTEHHARKSNKSSTENTNQRGVAATGKSQVQSWLEAGQTVAETGKEISKLDISDSEADLNKFIATTQSFATNEDKMREVAEILCNKALKNPRFARNASILCDRMAWMMVQGTKFRTVVLNVMQGHYKNREQLFASSFRSDGRWFGFATYLTEIFLNVRTASRDRLQVLVEPVFACLFQVLYSNQVDKKHIECFGNLFKRTGFALEKENPSRMNELMAEIRDRCVIAKTANVRRVLLGCVEMYATKWRSNDSKHAN